MKNFIFGIFQTANSATLLQRISQWFQLVPRDEKKFRIEFIHSVDFYTFFLTNWT